MRDQINTRTLAVQYLYFGEIMYAEVKVELSVHPYYLKQLDWINIH